ncbi:flagellar hook-associated protein 2 [Granulicella aggregans]|uniref:Flagellar hook-associated protein 2 n=1 Tax=Granulicella aggregans TaxID=474949 RepID=A0A7W7ZA78_9BACT|nr:flagellar filament capping protein FliD [Granulicella aggregans]MBB5056047.1 flagellar hook-associated protein 2 [Granulicella aggregans]
MGTVGINFGSATSGAGFDVASTVTSILAVQQAIETPWKTQLAALQAQDTVFSTLGTDLSTLSTSLSSLTSFDGVLAEKQGSSSNTNVLALTSADTTAVAGSHSVVVTSLATTASNYSDSITNASDTLSGSVTINGHQISVVSGTSDTLKTFATAINNAAIGVTASIVSDANGSRLSITSNTSGASGAITLSSNSLADSSTSTAIAFHTAQAGVNAALTVDGLAVSSASNTVTGAIPGVTFQLLSSPLNTTVQIQVTNDNNAIETSLSSLVTAYNAVIKDISGQEKTAQPLFGSPTLALIQTQLQTAIFGGSASGSINSLSQLGLTTNQDGTLSIDTSALDNALNANFSDIVGFFQNTGSFGQSFSKTLSNLGNSSVNGAVSLAQQQNSTQETGLNDNISKQDASIANQKTALTAELNAANQVLQAIPLQLSEISQIYSAISGYNQKNF